MKSIKAKFEDEYYRQPHKSTYLLFAKAVHGGGWSEPTVRRWFYKLVDPEDYERKKVKELMRALIFLSKSKKVAEDDKK